MIFTADRKKRRGGEKQTRRARGADGLHGEVSRLAIYSHWPVTAATSRMCVNIASRGLFDLCIGAGWLFPFVLVEEVARAVLGLDEIPWLTGACYTRTPVMWTQE